MRKLKKYIGLLIIPFCISLFSCGDDDPKNIDSQDEVVIYSMKILNAGADGSTVIEGKVDEYMKEISFPRLDISTDFSKIKVDATVSEKAWLESDVFDFSMGEEDPQLTKTIKVYNGTRMREYFMTLRKNIPVYGADFKKGTMYDHSVASGSVYPTFTSALTRGSAFDGEHVLIVTRHATGSHLLKVSDLKNNTVSPISLNLTGVTGGTFPVHSGALVNGRVYIANLSGGLVSPLKIYYWDNPSSEPHVTTFDKNTIPGSGVRHGDNMSVNVDENGNGYIYFGDNAATQILRFTVTNYTTINNPTILPTFAGAKATAYMSFNRVGATSDYIFTGFYAPIAVANEAGGVLYTMNASSTPEKGSDARVITFNGERYLIMCTAARSGSDPTVFYVYNITKGETTIEALQLFDARTDKSPDFEFSLGGPVNTSPATQTGWYVEKDNDGKDHKLYLYAATCDAGFVICEFPIKSQED